MYRIGQLAEALHISVSKLRFLESKGLLSPQRHSSGYRYYTEESKSQLQLILTAQQMGFRLEQIRLAMLNKQQSVTHPMPCQVILPLLHDKVAELEQQIQQLRQQQAQVQQLAEQLAQQ